MHWSWFKPLQPIFISSASFSSTNRSFLSGFLSLAEPCKRTLFRTLKKYFEIISMFIPLLILVFLFHRENPHKTEYCCRALFYYHEISSYTFRAAFGPFAKFDDVYQERSHKTSCRLTAQSLIIGDIHQIENISAYFAPSSFWSRILIKQIQ